MIIFGCNLICKSMKSFKDIFSKITILPKTLYILLFVVLTLSCEKDNKVELDFEFQVTESYLYPDKHVTGTFNILPVGGVDPYSVKWFSPDFPAWENPFSVYTDSTLILDFEILDAAQNKKRFIYELSADSIGAQAEDYRYQYVGLYDCEINYEYEGSSRIHHDTLKVTTTNDPFYNINISVKNGKGNWVGNGMRYLWSNSFYGYHSGVTFTKDSIYYRASGPLGFYYTEMFKGRKIIQ